MNNFIKFIIIIILCACSTKPSDRGVNNIKINKKAKNDILTYFEILKSSDVGILKNAVVNQSDLQNSWLSYKLSQSLPKIFIPAKKNIKVSRQYGELLLLEGVDFDYVIEISFSCLEACEQKIRFYEFDFDGKYNLENILKISNQDVKNKFVKLAQGCKSEALDEPLPLGSSCPLWFLLDRFEKTITVYEAPGSKVKDGDQLKSKMAIKWDRKMLHEVPASKQNTSLVWTSNP